MFERTSVGLDVHACSVAGCALDARTGEILPHRMTPDHREILAWIISLPTPVKSFRRQVRAVPIPARAAGSVGLGRSGAATVRSSWRTSYRSDTVCKTA
jgi:hypothetical protein